MQRFKSKKLFASILIILVLFNLFLIFVLKFIGVTLGITIIVVVSIGYLIITQISRNQEFKREKLTMAMVKTKKINSYKIENKIKKNLERKYWKPEFIRNSIIFKKDIQIKTNNNSILYYVFKENHILKKIEESGNIKITLLEGDFLNKVELFDWEDKNEKQLFVKEMLALSPKERKLILDDMSEDFGLNFYRK